jgi:DUF971 family protein
MSAAAVWPVAVVMHEATGRLELSWSDGAHASLSGQRLRLACRCAGCVKLRRSHQPIPGDDSTGVVELRPVGEMGLQILFNDGHDRGIFPWSYLHELSQP